MSGRNVWLASYPKSGNTWLRAVHSALCSGTDPDINQLRGMEPPASRTAFDTALGLRGSDLTRDEVQSLRRHADEVTSSGLAEDAWRKIHDALFRDRHDAPVVSPRTTRIALYIVRDPRDVAVSFAYHNELTLAQAVEFMEARGATLAEDDRRLLRQLPQYLGTWSEHVTSWTEQPPFPVHVLRYEDCINDPIATFGAAFRAAGLHASENDLAEALERCSFRRLQQVEASEGFRERLSPRSRFFRRGTAGGWKDEMPPDMARRVVDVHGATMARFDYEL